MKTPQHDSEFEILTEAIASGFTQSEMTTFDTCAEKWYLGYARMLERKGDFSWALHYGSAIHASLEEFYLTKGKRAGWELPAVPKSVISTSETKEEWDYWNHVGEAQIAAYRSTYKGDFEVFDFGDRIEIEPHVEFEGILLKGKIDALPLHKKLKGYFVLDHKTTSRLNEETAEGWNFRFQFMFYVWLASRHSEFKKLNIIGTLPNAIKKPELRVGKGETHKGFAERVKLDMLTRPESYFYRDLKLMSKGDMERFEKEMLRPKIERLKFVLGLADGAEARRLKAAFLRNKNTDACFHYNKRCAFFNICKNGWNIEKEGFKVRGAKHGELAALQ